MKPRLRRIFSWAGLFVLLPFAAAAGQLDKSAISADRNWQPTGCHKPVAPSTKVYDLVSYNVAVSMFNTYREEVSGYFACASAEAEKDYTTFRKVLSGSLEDLQGEVMSQFEALKNDLELSRKAFE